MKKKILLGICGSIAAYKSAYLIREFVRGGHDVKVIMTPAAKDFITPLTLSTLSKQPVLIDFVTPEGNWNNHVDLAEWADIIVIAPVTANMIAKMAGGICDNLLLATYLSSIRPVYIAPAMDLEMYRHPSTKRNLEALLSDGVNIIPAEEGELASGLYGEGRMAEPVEIVRKIEAHFHNMSGELKGMKVMITAGPTYEAIDPVRFIGNHSSGKMGFAIAEEFAARGAEVTLIAGPVALKTYHPNIRRINVTSAEEMYRQCMETYADNTITVMAAAVADFTPKYVSNEKIKKEKKPDTVHLTKTKDILEALGKKKKNDQLLIGFALETENEMDNATRKVKNKNLDFIVLNSLKDPGAGFGTDTNKITIIDRNNNITAYELKSKHGVAGDIIEKALAMYKGIKAIV